MSAKKKYSKDLTERITIRLTPEQFLKYVEKGGASYIRAFLDRKPVGRKRKRGRR